MEKWINFTIQAVAYFIIVLIVFFIASKMGFNSGGSIWIFSIGSTIGWMIVQGFSVIKKQYNGFVK
ncbi:MAG: hypothetical protein GX660_01460 [Clostridiaceae bacterium]|nr:hypothetical protein [Clostridiaceae bacterium]